MFSAPVIVTPPSGELISVDDAKSFLRVDGDALDIEIEMLAAAAVGDLEDMTGLRLLTQTVRVEADTFADLELFRIGPVQTVTSVKYVDSSGTGQSLAGDRFDLTGALFEQGLRPIGSWPASNGPIEITLVVGFGEGTDVPKKLLFAAYSILRGKHEDRDVDVSAVIANNRFWL